MRKRYGATRKPLDRRAFHKQKINFNGLEGRLTYSLFVVKKTIADNFIVEDKRYFAYMQIDII